MTENETGLSRFLKKTGASLFFLGYIPRIPGTIGSLAAISILWFARNSISAYFQPAFHIHYWLLSVLLIVVSILLSNNSKDIFGEDDAKQIIVDEFTGQFITFFMIPFSWRTLILGFMFFRFYDIVKPFPIYKMEELEEGLGITMDDVVAGVFANISLIISLLAYHAIKSLL